AARKEMDFIGSSRESPSPAPREREGPSAQRREGEGLSGGGHPSPAFALRAQAPSPAVRERGFLRHNLSSRLVLPFNNFWVSSADSGKVLIHSAPGGLSMNG